ncbi:hypothetical protein QQ008_18165 [Fulvivirgaceae bacterium BMA10]|uniref:Uncharacterized protein n=1 Tax=Splendidivirga corallicola TaxID=3051826 RepID=A0ABT8KT05_9BACT|nr:hypothetical protein [Fulvivirgaceae bacterium BMA10]
MNAAEDNGKIDLVRLATISESIHKIAEGALQIRLKGISISKGRKKESLKQSLKVTLSGLKKGSTILCLESQKFKDTLDNIQLDIFRSETQIDLQEQTPISLFVSSFNEISNNGDKSELLDKSLLKELKNFKKAFLQDNETFIISNEDSFESLELSKKSFEKINILEGETPEAESIILNGIVEELKYSKLRVKIITEEGTINGFLSDELSAEDISLFWGKEITITGTNHYKSNKTSVIEIKRIHEPSASDKYFSRKSKKALSVEDQIKYQIDRKSANSLSDIVGKWSDEDKFEDLIKML